MKCIKMRNTSHPIIRRQTSCTTVSNLHDRIKLRLLQSATERDILITSVQLDDVMTRLVSILNKKMFRGQSCQTLTYMFLLDHFADEETKKHES